MSVWGHDLGMGSHNVNCCIRHDHNLCPQLFQIDLARVIDGASAKNCFIQIVFAWALADSHKVVYCYLRQYAHVRNSNGKDWICKDKHH